MATRLASDDHHKERGLTDPLSIDELLRRLDLSLIDADIHKRCVDAERLCRQREVQTAIHAARAAANLAVAAGEPLTIGAAFLYLAVVRHSSGLKNERDAAPIDGSTAIGWLKRNDHQWAIASLIQARFLLNDGRSTAALEYYQQAAMVLIRLAKRSAYNKQPTQERTYWELQRAVARELRRVQIEPGDDDRTARLPSRYGIRRYSQPGRRVSPFKFTIPARVIWPDDRRTGLGLLPPSSGSAPDFLEISYLTLQGRRFSIQPIDTALAGEVYHMRSRQVYAFLQIEPDQPDIEDECYVIVRQQSRPDQNRQYLVIVDTAHQQAWIDSAESAAPHTQVHIIGLGREWNIHDGSETELDDDPLRVFGVVEAILRVPPDDTR